MKHKWILITLAVIFFLTALTFYANRVIFPTVVKKIAIEQAQNFLRRKVEIESLHFNWLKGVIINRIKIYQKGSSSEVFAQAEKISIGVIFIPGVKEHKLVFPFINVEAPSIYLIHQADNQWNFSDLLLPAPAKANDKPLPVTVSVTGINIINGKIRLDDLQPQGLGTELIDTLNLKVGLGISGISFDGSLSLPKRQGALWVDGVYQPINQSVKASVSVKNIKPLDYLALVPLKLPMTLSSGTINDLNAHVDYSSDQTQVQGSWSIKNIDVTIAEHNIKTDMDVAGAKISINKNSTSVKGAFSLANTKILTPTFSVAGTFKANVDNFVMNSPDDISLRGSLQTDLLTVKLPNDRSFQGQINASVTNGVMQKGSSTFEGNFALSQAFIALADEQNMKGDLKFNTIRITRDKELTTVTSDVSLNAFDIRFPGQILKGNLNADHFNISLDAKNNIKASGAIDLTNIEGVTEKASLKGALHLKNIKASFDNAAQTIDVQTQGVLQDISAAISGQGNLHANAHFEAHAQYPLKDPSGLQYNGSVALEDALFDGTRLGAIKNINLTTDFKTDNADIQNMSLNVLDTAIKASGTIKHFLKPMLNLQVESERFDLSKIKDVAPDLLKTYGLTVDGETSFKIKFEGSALDPLSAKVNADAVLKNVNVQSSTLKQDFKNISATLSADGHSLTWKDFTVTIMDQPLTSQGHVDDFKNPKMDASLSWQGMDVKTKVSKNDNLVDIKDISAKYKSADFHANGSIDLSGKTPQLDIKSDVKFKLDDLAGLVPSLKSTLEPLKLSGDITSTSSFKGPLSDWKNWTVLVTTKSDLVSIAGFKFNNIALDVDQEEGKIKKFNVTSTLYEGTLNIVTTADLSDPLIPFDTALHIENVNLAKLKNDTGAKDEDLRGFIALTSVVKGNIKDIMKITGNGALNVSQGYLMKKEFSSLFMIPQLSNLIFTDATANFTIADQKISTENFVLKSEGANLNGKGWVGFDHKIQFELHPEFNTDKIVQSDSMRKGPSALIALAAGTYLTINIDGTVDKPQVHTIKKPTEILKKTGELLKNNVGDILQGLFQ